MKEKESFESLQEAIDVLSQTLECAITLEDRKHRLLAYSKHKRETDQARISTIMNRQVPDEVIQRLWQNGTLQQLNQSDEPLRIPGILEVGLGERIAVAIRNERYVLGYIWALELVQPLGNKELDYLKKVVEVIKQMILKEQENRHQRRKKQESVWTKLFRGSISNHAAQEVLRTLQVPIPTKGAVIHFECSTTISQEKDQVLTFITERVKSKLHVSFAAFIEDSWIVFVSTHTNAAFMENELEEFGVNWEKSWQEQEPQSTVYWGIGRVCDTLEHLAKSKQEAKEVVQLKKVFDQELRGKRFFDELGFYRLFLSLPKDTYMWFQSETLKTLVQYDKKQQTELTKTLETLLDVDCRMNEAASILHVHPNTLNYRVRRMIELTGLQLKDMKEKVNLYMELKLLKWMEKDSD
ncbi:PucR family transcriptional regulator [Halalkalibacterium ligniniphilum]|uniref:PucR family transcriptional regulator n=1 Tax=Halalkalibacterium ligniniphilum TaxID=1134413 RepID=UPI000344BB0E|nr:PucR family transcriptional regulator [Halalkalibacterium ligniniphilum]